MKCIVTGLRFHSAGTIGNQTHTSRHPNPISQSIVADQIHNLFSIPTAR